MTDVPLTERGEVEATRLRARLAERPFVLVATSPRRRARRTAQLAGLVDAVGGRAVTRDETWDDLAEWDYGDYEGVTTPEIRRTVPGWTVFGSKVPGGETPQQVAERADAVISRSRPFLEDGDVAFVGHGHMLRVVVARWLGLEPQAGAMFVLDPGGLSELGYEHGTPAILRLNEPP